MPEFKTLVSKTSDHLLRSEVFRPFGLTLLKYNIILTDKIPQGVPAATDYKRIYINPDHPFYTKCKVPIEYIVTFAITHELGHIILMHNMRKGHRDDVLWGYAIDYMLNLFLHNIEIENNNWENQLNLVQMKINKYKDLICYDESFQGMLEEEIYDKLENDGNYSKNVQEQSYKDFLDKVGVPSEGVELNDKIKVTTAELDFNGTKKKKVFIDFPETIQQSDSSDGNESSLDDQLAKTMFENNILSQGFKNLEFEQFLKRLFNIKVPWQTILQDSILIELQKSTNISYGRPRLAWLAQPNLLPYLPSYEEEEVLGTLVILIDESASINDDDVTKAIDIARQSDSYYKNVYVIKHDTVCKWDKFYSDKLTNDDIDELLIRRHSGGTSHKDAFKKVVEFSNKPDCNVSLVISITDMASDIEEAQKLLPRTIPRIYLLNREGWDPGNVKGKVINIK